jgi:hypothetical protein
LPRVDELPIDSATLKFKEIRMDTYRTLALRAAVAFATLPVAALCGLGWKWR